MEASTDDCLIAREDKLGPPGVDLVVGMVRSTSNRTVAADCSLTACRQVASQQSRAYAGTATASRLSGLRRLFPNQKEGRSGF